MRGLLWIVNFICQFSQAIVNGQAFCGTLASLVSLVSFAIGHTDNVDKGNNGITYCTFIYFAIGVGCVFGCSIVMNVLPPEEELRITPTLSISAEQVFLHK